VLGPAYDPIYMAASDEGLDKLALRARIEDMINDYLKTHCFPHAEPGNLSQIHDFMFYMFSDYCGHGNPEHEKLVEEIRKARYYEEG
ncbi:hypothetical protein KY311_03140, partial [Candidatus Woesearchaeota archaeon]|nr:hypothetical protein [Candidatus Woesearchaeota archaeon]